MKSRKWDAIFLIDGTEQEILFSAASGDPFPRKEEIVILNDRRYVVDEIEWDTKFNWIHIKLKAED